MLVKYTVVITVYLIYRFRTSGISSLSTCLKFIANWIWPPDRCSGQPDYCRPEYHWRPDLMDDVGPSLGSIHRAADGRFVLRASTASLGNDSSSDEGGFIPKRGHARASWRKPLVGYPSQLSLRSDGSGQSARFFPGYFYPPVILPAIYTPNPRFQASSPAIFSPWSPVYFSDLSSVRQTSSGDRSFPTPPSLMRIRSMHQRFSQELPSLHAIHEETKAMTVRSPRSPRSPRRLARSAPDLARHHSHEPSPESRSSSSGFGSKNTSQQNQSSRSGSTGEWRLPPYRPPPPPPGPPAPPLWLELALLAPSMKALDAGSVDAHYEFDPASPTPTASTPTERAPPPMRSRHRDMEARVQAMKEEFYEFRKRQAQRHRSRDLESIC